MQAAGLLCSEYGTIRRNFAAAPTTPRVPMRIGKVYISTSETTIYVTSYKAKLSSQASGFLFPHPSKFACGHPSSPGSFNRLWALNAISETSSALAPPPRRVRG